MRGRPWRFLLSAWPWRALAYDLGSVVVGLAWLMLLALVLGIGLSTVILVVGLFVLAAVPALAHLAAVLERRRLRLVLPHGTEESGERPSLRESWRVQRGLPVAWSEVGHLVLLATLGWLVGLLAAAVAAAPVILLLAPWLADDDVIDFAGWRIDSGPEPWMASALGLVLLVVAAYVVTWLACGHAALTRLLLDPSDARLAEAVAAVRRSRSGLADAYESERRRIERDLHDGVQQRLLALTMTLGSAELEAEGPTLTLVRQAHEQAEQALAELRTTVRGIHPRVLTDHGLTAAVHEVADRSPVPVHLGLALDERLPAPVEAAAYFFVSEALTNVVRHAGAGSAQVHAWTESGSLVLTVSDDGHGGAEPRPGSGLEGLRLRVEAMDGSMRITSPPGGPTSVRMTCPLP